MTLVRGADGCASASGEPTRDSLRRLLRRDAPLGPRDTDRQEDGQDRCRHGYAADVISIPGDRHRPGSAALLFFATRRAAEDYLYRGERERAGQAAPQAPPLKELRRAMADAHPDRGGTAEQFIQARRRYQTALAITSRSGRPFTSAEDPSRHQGAH
jgi:hypothetical protein